MAAIEFAKHKFRFDVIIDRREEFYLQFIPTDTLENKHQIGKMLEKYIQSKLKLNNVIYRPDYRAAGLIFEIREDVLKDLFKRLLNL